MGHYIFVEDHQKHMNILMTHMGLPTFQTDTEELAETLENAKFIAVDLLNLIEDKKDVAENLEVE